jgi:hypothetical protein
MNTDRRDDLLAPKQFARELNLNVSAVYLTVERAQLPAVRLLRRGSIGIPRSAIQPRKGWSPGSPSSHPDGDDLGNTAGRG